MTAKERTTAMEAAQAAVSTLSKRFGANIGSQIANQLGARTRTDVSAAQFCVGDTLFVPETNDKLFRMNFGSNGTTGVVCGGQNAEGQPIAKSLYFSALDRDVPEYNDSLVPTGNIVSAKTAEYHEVYDVINGCANEQELWDAIKGKNLKVVAMNPVKAARYADGAVSGVRNRMIPVFAFVD